ncbi:MAG: hypothetical protein M1825_003198 [Sarcosagium campestre]|nr:MAG: hypothetical protein M1825_003198 [Sarcosagium campestre]
MSFGRSASGPGGLSINTGSVNSVFANQNSQSQPSKSLFGAVTTSQPAQSGSLFGAATTQQSGLGSNPQQQQSNGGGLNLFGSLGQNQQQVGTQGGETDVNASTGRVGSADRWSQPQANSNPFGGSLGQSQPQQTQTGGLFGASNQQSQPQQSGSLFAGLGQNQSQPASQQGGTSSLFGSLGTQTQQQQQQQPQRLSLLGAGNASSTPFSGGLSLGQGGQQTVQNQSTVPGVKIDVSNLRPTTRFSELHEDLQKFLELVDEQIRKQMEHANACKARLPTTTELFTHLPQDVELLTRRMQSVTQSHDNDVSAIAQARETVKLDAADAKLSFAAIDNLKLPAHYHTHGLWNSVTGLENSSRLVQSTSANSIIDKTTGIGAPSTTSRVAAADQSPPEDLVAYFEQRVGSLGATLENYKQSAAAIESHLRGVEARTMQQMQQLQLSRTEAGGFNADGSSGEAGSAEEQIRQLAAVLRDFESGILTVAGSVGGAREAVQQLVLSGGDAGVVGRSSGIGSRNGIY